MFTGIVEDLGEVEAVEQHGDFARVRVRSAVVASDARPGDSICVSGVCLTVTGLAAGPGGAPLGFTADIMGETLARSSLKTIVPGARVNLERPVRLADRLGGHLVQGHVDATAAVLSRAPRDAWEVVRISLPDGLARYVVRKGSIAVDGVSLTVSGLGTGTGTGPAGAGRAASPGEAGPDWFEVSLIPETLKRTTLGIREPGDEVNLEVDVIAKYVEKLTGGTR